MPGVGQAPDPNMSGVALRAALTPWLITGYLIIGGVFVALGGWASTAPIAQAVVANGSVKVDSNRKRVQHQEGGTVREIYVRDGDRVDAGEVLVRLDATRAEASLGIVNSSYDAELARSARLASERDGLSTIKFPPHLTDRAGDPAVDELLKLQTQLFEARRNSLEAGIEILASQITQLRAKQEGTQSLLNALDGQATLVDEEMEKLRSLFGKGFVDQSRLRALQIEKVRIVGERGDTASEIAGTKTAIAEKRQEILQVRYGFQQTVADELREAQAATLDLKERLDAASHVVDHIDIRAPVDGIVVSLAVFSEGEVVRPGDVVLELVPLDEALTIEAKVRLMDIDNLVIGQQADVRFTAFDSRNTPVLQGHVDYISADALEDQRTGQGYFKIKVNIATEELEELGEQVLLPGMPADVIIKTGERTVLQYVFKPISNALAKAWTEQ
jgi:HlyD family type I secretion membrane fusion protein